LAVWNQELRYYISLAITARRMENRTAGASANGTAGSQNQ